MKAYHCSPYLFTEIDYEFLLKNRTNHVNGALGLWCGLATDWIRGFGPYLYEVEVSGNFYEMSINELLSFDKAHYEEEEYSLLRQKLINQNYAYIKIIEANDSCGMIVILDFEKVKISRVSP